MLRFFPLGGLGEVGMNCLALEQDGRVMIVDCGVTFDARALGAPVVHPDFGGLEAWRDRIAGVFLTHGHEDHIGALPYLLTRFDVPVWGPAYAIELVREKADEHEILRHARLEVVKTRETIAVGPFEVEPIRVTHSIADATALAIKTSEGTVIHTGDFKFDPEPPDGEMFDEARFRELGDAGVSLLFSDSTNAFTPGETASETSVGRALRDVVLGAKGAVFVAMFASNVHRLRLLGEIAKDTGRRIVLLGRSVETHARVARRSGYLSWPSDLVWPKDRLELVARSSILAIATGTQGEARGALARLSKGGGDLEVLPGDTVVLSSRVIPGNEREVYGIIDDLIRKGAIVRSWLTDRTIHTSGHAHKDEQRRMLELVRPRTFVPVHGMIQHLTALAEIARALGIDPARVVENGAVVELSNDALEKVGRVHVGRVHVHDGHEVPRSVLAQRARLAEEGFVHVTIAGDAIEVLTQGVVDADANADLLEDAKREARITFDGAADQTHETRVEWVRLAVRRVFARATGTKPQTHVTIIVKTG
jgi:ribonuclease J